VGKTARTRRHWSHRPSPRRRGSRSSGIDTAMTVTRGTSRKSVGSADVETVDALDPFLAAPVRTVLEERYWRPIECAALVDEFIRDPTFVREPERHPALFADHGVVHVRDVAHSVLEVLATVDGLLLPARSPERFEAMAAVAVTTAYIHDIGMVEPSQRRRRVHPQWAAQEVYRPAFDDILDLLGASGNPLIRRVREAAPFAVPELTVVREVLAMSMCHSKTVVPATHLDDHVALRELVQAAVLTDLDTQLVRHGEQHPAARCPEPSPALRHYADPSASFAWLTSEVPAHRTLATDVVDAVRVLRAADALRQRGTVLRTSAGYEMFLDTGTAEVVYAIHTADSQTLHLRFDNPIAAGEAAIRCTSVTADGHLRVWFHGGRFASDAVRDRAARQAAAIVADVQADVLPTFSSVSRGPGVAPPRMEGRAMRIELAGAAGGMSFADRVAHHLRSHHPDLAARLAIVDDELPEPPVDHAEHERFAAGSKLDPDSEVGALVRRHAGRAADQARDMDLDRAFVDGRLLNLGTGEMLVRPGTSAGFVYLPTRPGLAATPLGGYQVRPISPWAFVGATGVVRHGERNAGVHAEAPVDVVAIPAELFRRAWFRPLRPVDLARVVGAAGRM
jgi:hypothetical protein